MKPVACCCSVQDSKGDSGGVDWPFTAGHRHAADSRDIYLPVVMFQGFQLTVIETSA